MPQSTVKRSLSDYLWGEKASTRLLCWISLLLIFGMLGSRTLWTMERRWANIILTMLSSGDYLHPYLFGEEYYDKPLLSYWLVVPFAKLFQHYNTFILRLPTAIAGCATLWLTYRFSLLQHGRSVALKATWMLLTCFGFIFWSRVAGADMYNIMGIMAALLWYKSHEEDTRFVSYLGFILIIVFACLCKGLVALACIGLVVLPDFIVQKGWQRHLNIKLLLAITIGLVVYVLPFWLSVHFNNAHYQESGLFEVFHENVVRFFAPFDHKGPWYTYFIYVPYYCFPWVLFFVPALLTLPKRWAQLSWNRRWLVWMTVLLFVFFSLSQSRRSYYILPLMPFVSLVVADWLSSPRAYRIAAWTTVAMVIVLAAYYWVGLPIYYHGVNHDLH